MVSFLIREFRRFPATMTLCGLWVGVYLGIVWWQGTFQPSGNPFLQGASSAAVHVFGSMTASEIRQGQWWRALTATCIHGGLLHIGMNLLGFYRLGQMIEEWYGSAQSVFLYVVLGLGGNLLAAAAKLAFHYHADQASVGGSIVLCGFMSMIGLVGRRSGTKVGRLVFSQVLGGFIALGFLGAMIPIFDNVGHAGGAVAGALVSFCHRPLLRTARRPFARALGAGGLAVLILCAVLQARYARAESLRSAQAIKAQREHQLTLAADRQRAETALALAQQRFTAIGQIWLAALNLSAQRHRFNSGISPRQIATPHWTIEKAIETLSQIDEPLRTGAESQSYLRVLELARGTLGHRPTPGQIRDLELNVERVLNECRRSISREAKRVISLGPPPVPQQSTPAKRQPGRP